MKVIMKPIEMIAMFKEKGAPVPIKCRFKQNNKETVIKVDNIVSVAEEKLAGNKMYRYHCQSDINGRVKDFELKFELSTCKWFLYKM